MSQAKQQLTSQLPACGKGKEEKMKEINRIIRKKRIHILLAAALLGALLSGCGKSAPDMTLAQTDVTAISVPEIVQVVGLGEASHGVKE